MLDRKVGRPSLEQGNQLEYEEQPMLRRSQSQPCNIKLCIICQIKNKYIRHSAQTLQMGDKMLLVAQKLSNKGFCRRLNSISAANDTPTNDVMYHNSCWVNAKREANKTYETFSEKYYINSLSDVNFVEKEIVDPSGNVLDMNIINEIYQQNLSSNSKNEASINRNCKKYLKELISKNVCGISFVKSKNPSKPGQLISDSTTSKMLDTFIEECTADNVDQIWRVAKIIHCELLQTEKWHFTGLFDDFTLPPLIATLMKWIIIGKNR